MGSRSTPQTLWCLRKISGELFVLDYQPFVVICQHVTILEWSLGPWSRTWPNTKAIVFASMVTNTLYLWPTTKQSVLPVKTWVGLRFSFMFICAAIYTCFMTPIQYKEASWSGTRNFSHCIDYAQRVVINCSETHFLKFQSNFLRRTASVLMGVVYNAMLTIDTILLPKFTSSVEQGWQGEPCPVLQL